MLTVTLLHIQDLAYGGAGVGRAEDGVAVFVDDACPGDTVRVEVTADHGRYRTARVVDVIEPSPHRVKAPCPYFGECGGCHWQHVDYGFQLLAKQTIISEAFARIGHAEASVAPTIASPSEYGYRNKIELSVAETPTGPALGFTARDRATVLPVDRCLLLPRAASRAPKALSGALRFLAGRTDVPVERVGLRVAVDGQVEVDVWTAPGPFPRQLAARVLADAVGATTVTRVLFKGPLKARRVTSVEVLTGPGAWRERLGPHRYLVSAPSFFQSNTAGAVALRDEALRTLEPRAGDVVLDLYAGVGTFTLPLVGSAGSVIAVESSRFALADLRRNLAAARLAAEIVPGDAGRALQGVDSVDLAVVDPPRAGLDDRVLLELGRLGPRCIAYVSCDPATLARDAGRLAEHGYRPTRVTPVDLFPQTYHVETVAAFQR